MESESPANNEEAPGVRAPRASKSDHSSKEGTDMNHSSTTMVHSNVQGQTSPAVSMSSVEIAETTGKKHMHVIRDVRAMLKQLYGAYPNLDGSDIKGVFEELRSDNGQTKAFHLDREHAECLVTGYSAALRMKVIRRLRELEEKAAKPDPMKALNDPATLREVLLGYSERVLELESTVSEQAPKVDAYDRISNAEGSLCLTDASKHLQVQRKRLIAWLHANRWIYRRVGNKNWVAYEDRRKQQVLTHKTTTITLDDGSERLCEQVRVTPKGLAKLAVVFDQEAAA